MPLALPTCAERQQALQASCAHMALAADVRLAEVAAACNGYAAADLLALVREAAMLAVRRASAAPDAVAASDAAAAAPDAAAAAAAAPAAAAPPRSGAGPAAEARVCAADWRDALRLAGAAVGRQQTGLQGGAMEPLPWEEIGCGRRRARTSDGQASACAAPHASPPRVGTAAWRT